MENKNCFYELKLKAYSLYRTVHRDSIERWNRRQKKVREETRKCAAYE